MRKIDAKCKFCHRPLVLEIDESYDEVGDPLSLIPAAACNRCADLREARRNLVEAIRAICYELETQRLPRLRNELLERIRPILRKLLQEYQSLAEDWHRGDPREWDESQLESMVSKPKEYGNVLKVIWELSRQRTPKLL